ncbi:MAG: hypothetical protein JXN65_03080 [Clostridia bacterium]|nr:hypothetical protein [Clostridia bacterium]
MSKLNHKEFFVFSHIFRAILVLLLLYLLFYASALWIFYNASVYVNFIKLALVVLSVFFIGLFFLGKKYRIFFYKISLNDTEFIFPNFLARSKIKYEDITGLSLDFEKLMITINYKKSNNQKDEAKDLSFYLIEPVTNLKKYQEFFKKLSDTTNAQLSDEFSSFLVFTPDQATEIVRRFSNSPQRIYSSYYWFNIRGVIYGSFLLLVVLSLKSGPHLIPIREYSIAAIFNMLSEGIFLLFLLVYVKDSSISLENARKHANIVFIIRVLTMGAYAFLCVYGIFSIRFISPLSFVSAAIYLFILFYISILMHRKIVKKLLSGDFS